VLIGIGVVMLLSRVNSALVDLLSQLVHIATAVGRMLALIVILVVISSVVLLHI
jgi:hypothetical protein